MVTDVKKQEQELSQNYTDKFVDNERFFTKPKTKEGRDFFIFSDYGDYIKGIILARRSNAHIARTNSFVIKAFEKRQGGIDYELPAAGQAEEFFANRQLQKIFEQNEVIGKCIKVVYIGKQKSTWSKHSMKIYRVFWDKGVIVPMEQPLYVKTKKRA
jgi:hypothetical protein